jgi:predicted nucleotidyltransferase
MQGPTVTSTVTGGCCEGPFRSWVNLWYTRRRFCDVSSLNDALIRDIVRRIVDTVQPEKVILFGSQARGDARPNSDFDLLVIKQSDEPRYRRSIPLYVALADLPVEVEVMVYTPEEVDEWSQVPQAFVTTAVREGTAIYERRG